MTTTDTRYTLTLSSGITVLFFFAGGAWQWTHATTKWHEMRPFTAEEREEAEYAATLL